MAAPEVVICNDIDAISRRGAVEFVRAATASIKEAGLFRVALSGGTTPMAMYRLLSTHEFTDNIDWRRVRVFFGDERCVPPGDDKSNFKTAQAALLNEVGIPEENIHRIKAESAKTAARLYEEVLVGEFGLAKGELPRFDLILLGIGADGHTASIFPGSPALNETKRLVMAVKPPEGGTARITLTPPVINNAKRIIFLVSGEAKAEALKLALGPDPADIPARITRGAKGAVQWIVDKAAARVDLSKD